MTSHQTENITLYYREGSSDKVYHAEIEPSGPGFVVTFAYGRRGSTLQTGTKTATPVGFDEAKRIYDKLVKEKTGKGYTSGESGTPYQQTEHADRATGIVPQLLNTIDESEIEKYLVGDQWWMQEKFDGRRVLIRKQGEIITAINRNGLTTSLPLPIVEAVQLLSATDCLLDGEAVGDIYHAFDLLHSDVTDMRARRSPLRRTMNGCIPQCMPVRRTCMGIAIVTVAAFRPTHRARHEGTWRRAIGHADSRNVPDPDR